MLQVKPVKSVKRSTGWWLAIVLFCGLVTVAVAVLCRPPQVVMAQQISGGGGGGGGGSTGPTGPTGSTGPSGAAVTPWTACASGCTTTIGASPFTVSTSTHGQGSSPSIQCFLPGSGGTLFTPVDCPIGSDGIDTAGDITFTYTGVLGKIQIQSAGNSGASGSTGATGATGAIGNPVTVQATNLGTLTGGTSARILGTNYHNTNATPLFATVACQSTGAANLEMESFTDASTTPSAAINLQYVNATSSAIWLTSPMFIVLPGNWYRVADVTGNCGVSGASGTIWTEWH